MGGLYDRLHLNRIYFSAYQRGLDDESLSLEPENSNDIFMREHRLYQVDFLLRRYGFKDSEINFDKDGNLSLSADPKEIWAQNHSEIFPLNANSASKFELLRVPGLGPVSVNRILQRRKHGRLKSIEDVGKFNVRFQKACKYLSF